MTTRRLLDFEQLAELTGRPIRTLRDQRLKGDGLGSLGYKLDGRIVFDIAEVEEYLKTAKLHERREREAIQNGS